MQTSNAKISNIFLLQISARYGFSMSKPKITELSDRGLIKVSGVDCAEFLQNLVSCDIQKIEPNSSQFGALLSPQGKLLFDFNITRSDERFLFDIHRSLVPDFIKKLTMYKLRAVVEVQDLSDPFAIIGVWNMDQSPSWTHTTYPDPRNEQLGYRVIIERKNLSEFYKSSLADKLSLEDYNHYRIKLGIPAGINDFEYGQVFPHDVNMEYLNGIDFSKGCFVGQEVVSRMRHRGTARRRCVIAHAAEQLIPNTEITAAGKNIGLIGSVSNKIAIALIRLDRGKEAFDEKEKFFAGEIEVTFSQPSWTDFEWP